ncbi:unnamed protein product, partial [Mesorhabditis spiculigera]
MCGYSNAEAYRENFHKVIPLIADPPTGESAPETGLVALDEHAENDDHEQNMGELSPNDPYLMSGDDFFDTHSVHRTQCAYRECSDTTLFTYRRCCRTDVYSCCWFFRMWVIVVFGIFALKLFLTIFVSFFRCVCC